MNSVNKYPLASVILMCSVNEASNLLALAFVGFHSHEEARSSITAGYYLKMDNYYTSLPERERLSKI
jgi:hypothetical protein